MLRWEQKRLSEAANVSLETVKRLEGMTGPVAAHSSTVAGIQRALEGAGIEFIAENGGGAGLRLRQTHRVAAYMHNLRVSIKGARLVRFSYDDGPERWFAPHAVYRAHDGSERMRGSLILDKDSRPRAGPIIVRAAHDDFDLSRVSNFDLPKTARAFHPARGFAAADIKEAVTIHCAVGQTPVSR